MASSDTWVANADILRSAIDWAKEVPRRTLVAAVSQARTSRLATVSRPVPPAARCAWRCRTSGDGESLCDAWCAPGRGTSARAYFIAGSVVPQSFRRFLSRISIEADVEMGSSALCERRRFGGQIRASFAIAADVRMPLVTLRRERPIAEVSMRPYCRWLLFALPAVAASPLLAAPHASTACSAPVYRQFDFFAGGWDTYDIAAPDKVVARNTVKVILDGCVIHEDYRQNDGLHGESYSLYDAARKVWHQ